ncbi:unnamed protein product [Linum trigynum]|uniref:Transcription factor CBF/NF-Y/archaeal histone domain-containing protein n=1 Tax=Linum trigynum TaxID=586398 RepID=A0AAV2GT29_9ROSI
MAEEEEILEEASIRTEFPAARVKKITRLDKEVNKVTSEALFLTEVATKKKRKIVKTEHIRIAVKRHRPTNDFLLDSLPAPPAPQLQKEDSAGRKREVANKQPPTGTRRIDAFFAKSASGASA